MIEAIQRLTVPGPIPTGVSRPFWDAARKGRFSLQRCDECTRWVFYPRSHCPHCWSSRLSWSDASGNGTLKSYSIIHRPGHPAWTTAAPYALGLIELQEGPTMLSTLIEIEHDQLSVGMPLVVRFVPVGLFMLPMFTSHRPGNQKVPS